jgi:hypothetical protein
MFVLKTTAQNGHQNVSRVDKSSTLQFCVMCIVFQYLNLSVADPLPKFSCLHCVLDAEKIRVIRSTGISKYIQQEARRLCLMTLPHTIGQLILKELLNLRGISGIDRFFRIVKPTVVKNKLSITNKGIQGVVLVSG